MATTTAFGWETPDDTDLVKDGAAAIRTLGNSIDTSMSELKGGTTGQLLSKTSNTDMDFTWVASPAAGTWQSYTPTYTNLTVGNGTVVSRYTQSGKLVTVNFSIVFGSTTSLTGGTPAVSLPVNCTSGFNELVVAFGKVEDTGTAFYNGGAMLVDPDRFRWQVFVANSTYLTSDNVSPTVPMTWTTGDKYSTSFTYEAA